MTEPATSSEPQFDTAIFKNIMVPMRDGVRLATDVYRPARDGELLPGPWPTILARTSYDKTSPQIWVEAVANFFTPRGYAVVLQDLRGRHRSEGTGQYFHTANPKEGEDGYDTVEWIAAQPWSNGRVGTVGSSHGGMVQTAMALERPPHLRAMWIDVAPTNIYAHMSRQGGAMALHMFGALFLHAHDAQEIRDDPAAVRVIEEAMENLRDLVHTMPFKPGHTPLTVVPNLESMLFHYYHRGAYDEFWSRKCTDYSRYFDQQADIPAVYSGGWYDPFSFDTTDQFATMARKNSAPQRLLMGPWIHTSMRGAGDTSSGDVDFGPEAGWGDEVYNRERLRWFDRWLKDIPTGVDDDPPVRIFVTGGGDGRKNQHGKLNHGGRWRSEREWPLTRATRTTLYFHADGGLGGELPGDDDPPLSYSHDPANPVPTIAANVTGFYEQVPVGERVDKHLVPPRARMQSIIQPGAAHQKEALGIVGAKPPYRPLAVRSDVLVFQTEPLTEDIEITGCPEVTLWISSSAVDTDFAAKLIDVHPPNEDYPNGYAMNLVDSILRVRYRDSFEKEELMEPGRMYEIKIPLQPISNMFTAGHRIRLDISSSNFPRFDVNPNTGEPMGRHTHSVVARNTVYADRAHASAIVLPVIPINT